MAFISFIAGADAPASFLVFFIAFIAFMAGAGAAAAATCTCASDMMPRETFDITSLRQNACGCVCVCMCVRPMCVCVRVVFVCASTYGVRVRCD